MWRHSEFYYQAAWERIKEAQFLQQHGHYVMAMYVSGLAVECLLRAFRLLKDRTFDERHDLWLLWKSTALANYRETVYQDRISSSMNVVRLLWRNEYRFYSESVLRSHLKRMTRDRKVKGDFLKFNSRVLYDCAAEILHLGAQQWILLKKK